MADTVKSLDRWIFYQDKDGYVKSLEYKGVNVPASGLKISYSPEMKNATITINVFDFIIKNFPGDSVEGKE